jgi:hypothetical protein
MTALLHEWMSKLYLTLSGFKRSMKNLPGTNESFQDEGVAAATIPVSEVERFFEELAERYKEDIEETEMFHVLKRLGKLKVKESEEWYFQVYEQEELAGLTITVHKADSAGIEVTVFTEKQLAGELQQRMDAYCKPESRILH